MSDELLWTVLLGLFGSVALHSFQKWRDRKELIRARHFDTYVAMVEAVCAMGIAHMRGQGSDEALTQYFIAKAKFAVVASDRVMKKFSIFDGLITSGEKVENHRFDEAFGEFMKAAREENLGRSALTVEDLILATPYGKSVRREKAVTGSIEP